MPALTLVPSEHTGPAERAPTTTTSTVDAIVSTYPPIGLAILALGFALAAGYVANMVFYLVNHTWVAPVIVSASDDRVIAAKRELRAVQDQRDRTAAELAHAERLAAAEASQLELAKARADSEVLRASLGRQDRTLADLAQNAYVRAVDDHATVAMVPYDNLVGLDRGTPVHACELGFVGCREVGQVLDVLPGEVTFRHPRRDVQVRGRMVRLRLDEPAAVYRDMLFLGSAPLGL